MFLIFLAVTFFKTDNTLLVIGNVVDVELCLLQVEQFVINFKILEILKKVAKCTQTHHMDKIDPISTTE